MYNDIYLFNKLRATATYNIIGKIDENKSTVLRFHFKNIETENKHFYLDIENSKNEKYKTSEIIIKDNLANYIVPNSLLKVKGHIKVEPILYGEDNYILKYPTLSFEVVDSVNAIDEILEDNPDFASEFTQIKDIIKTDGEGNKFLSDSGKYIKIDEISSAKASNVLFEDGQNFQEKFDNGDLKGEKGDSGEKGDIGPQGKQGIQGIPGEQGPKGDKGDSFTYEDFTEEQLASLKGPQGEIGPEGPTGPRGEKGMQGIPGKDGSNGVDGKSAYDIWLELGNTGSKEEFINSLKGLDGVNGKDGLDGTNGVDGKDGSNGIDGEDGVTFIPSLDEEGNLSWTNDKGLENPKSINIRGPQGEQGIQGIQGVQGEQGPKGDKGETYTVTENDYESIANVVLNKMTNAEGVKF